MTGALLRHAPRMMHIPSVFITKAMIHGVGGMGKMFSKQKSAEIPLSALMSFPHAHVAKTLTADLIMMILT